MVGRFEFVLFQLFFYYSKRDMLSLFASKLVYVTGNLDISNVVCLKFSFVGPGPRPKQNGGKEAAGNRICPC